MKTNKVDASTRLQDLTGSQSYAREDGRFSLQRSIPSETGYDLVVAGGGPAGAAAAISAARLGAKVLLVESTGCLGGMGTSGLVTAFDPMGDGTRMLVGGFMREVVERLYERDYMAPGIDPNCWRKEFHRWSPFRAEGLKLILDEFALEAGVEVRFFTRVIDVECSLENKTIQGLVLSNIEGYRHVKAKTFIDATGDAILADLCGVPCWKAGSDTPRIMPSTLASLFTGIDWAANSKKVGRDQDAYLPQALAAGHFSQFDRHLPGLSKVGHQVGYLNGGHMFNLNALRCRDLSDGVMWGRKLAVEYRDFYRQYVPGCEKMEHVTTASLIGVRESRRIQGEYQLCLSDYLARREFPDQIGVFNKFVDIHPYDTSDEEWSRFQEESQHSMILKPGECFGIPYSILVPQGWTNLWVAGRCACSDVKVHGSIRVQPAASMMGQAAGTAAVQSLKTGQPACDLNTATLVETLRSAGAYLPQASLSQKMTRS